MESGTVDIKRPFHQWPSKGSLPIKVSRPTIMTSRVKEDDSRVQICPGFVYLNLIHKIH